MWDQPNWLFCFYRLDEMGALRQFLFVDRHQTWRLFTSPLLHAGLIHLLVNLSCVIYVGIHLEMEFGPGNMSLFKWSLFKIKNMKWYCWLGCLYFLELYQTFSNLFCSKDWSDLHTVSFMWQFSCISLSPRQTNCWFIRRFVWVTWHYACITYKRLEFIHQ